MNYSDSIHRLRELGNQATSLEHPIVQDIVIDTFLNDPEELKNIVGPYMADHGFLEVHVFYSKQYRKLLTEKEIPKLFVCLPFHSIERINLCNTHIEVPTLKEILSSNYMSQVKTLELSSTNIENVHIKEIIDSQNTQSLKTLYINNCSLTNESIRLLSKWESDLETLIISGNRIHDLTPLIDAPIMENIKLFDVSYNNIEDEILEKIRIRYKKLKLYP